MEQNTWQLQDAKSKFSQLVDNAMHHRPQFVTKHGSNAVVIISFEEYANFIKPKGDLVTFLRSSPLADSDLDFTRNKDMTRDIEL
ncbi:type II toxin-antitoxin system Phd/YefM family antitoxin [uncultured Thiothrix sp.]|jgi:prevent-host-death family protein|uniref:type II toxin-antitoxin system Phd/YefM family antitoxin n=1 Tax=uncultured Thiothrix sp. TaxID=223185 RepID=UPI00261A9452|nr:type II toxin-antitoxin system Phd/YefM family antitoxin [uncultured Thiothrix sp.]HMT91575.1 type II toxin-antitoxin system Phd/YefM family antitoxin [Thiolinea sp.]